MCFGVEGFIQGYLINREGVRFRESFGPGMPGVQSWLDRSRKKYQIADPDKFWRVFHSHPEKYGFDCLRIISFITVIEGVYGLLYRGYPLPDCLEVIKYIKIDGEQTSLRVGKKKVYPFGTPTWSPSSRKVGGEVCLASLVPIETSGNTNEWDLKEFSVSGAIRPGDIFFAGIHGKYVKHRLYGNADAQNGVILNVSGSSHDAREITVFAHQKEVESRTTSLFTVMSDLYQTAAKYGDDWAKFHQKGKFYLFMVRQNQKAWVDWLEEKIRTSPHDR